MPSLTSIVSRPRASTLLCLAGAAWLLAAAARGPAAAVGSDVKATPAAADAGKPDEAKPADGFVTLFNGKDLAGWVVTTCTAKAEGGSLLLVAGNGWVRTEKQYGDFVLDLEWRNRRPDKYDSGVYFRSPKPKVGRRAPDKYQINLLQGEEGSLVTNKQVRVVGDAKVKGLVKGGEWSRMRLTCVGGKAELEVNGKPAWKVEGIAPAVGFIGLQCEVEAGGQFEFRNVRVKPLTPPVEAPEE